ncbi:hypothetical protein [Arcobacter sp. FWKO B]|uniref:hypothetical protein n=1 Tax=Arcobacter sp. FWKO B TaxID=2593672 RepID=UPI0018A558A2|nr:hypothetical protein [Arcobacter sp. FWKO B]QOG13050.1 hypothetical protein FWKOB_10270 [Arcobacter sp. FWKO B]
MTSDIQRIDTVSGGQNAQNVCRDMIQNNKINIQIENTNDLLFQILKYKKESINFPKYQIVIQITKLYCNIEKIDELFQDIENFVYNPNPLNLNLQINHTECSDLQTQRMSSMCTNKIERFIFKSYFEYKNDIIKKLSYSIFYKIIQEINNEMDAIITCIPTDEENYLEKTVRNFFYNYYGDLMPYNHYNSKDFFKHLDNNNAEYLEKNFIPKTINEFFEYKIRNDLYIGWEFLYIDIKDYDFYIFTKFLFRTPEDKYKITLSGLKQFIADNNYTTEMCDDIDGCIPYSLENICWLKHWNIENSPWWTELMEHELVNSDCEYIYGPELIQL